MQQTLMLNTREVIQTFQAYCIQSVQQEIEGHSDTCTHDPAAAGAGAVRGCGRAGSVRS